MATNGIVEPASTSDNFWEIDGFKRTVRRTEDGMHQCGELMKMMQERAEIEKDYAKRLRVWCRKWADNAEKGPEYGSMKTTLKSCMESTDRLAECHIAVKDRLMSAVQTRVKEWRNEHYKKSLMGGCREAKSFEDDFRKAQKPWMKKYTKVMKAKKDYYGACKQDRAATAQENTMRAVVDTAADQIRKAQERTERCQKETEAARQRYSRALLDLDASNGKYTEDMIDVFDRTQTFERRRLEFMKSILLELHNSLDYSQNQAYVQVYKQIRENIQQADSSADLKWWSVNHGPEMNMSWPTFEEYSGEPVERVGSSGGGVGAMTNGEFSSSSSSSTRPVSYGSARSVDAVTYAAGGSGTVSSASAPYSSTQASNDVWNDRPTTSVHSSSAAEASSSYVYGSVVPPSQRQIHSHSNDVQDPFEPVDSAAQFSHVQQSACTDQRSASLYANEGVANSGPFYEEIATDHGAGIMRVMVRALYDYEAVEDDELSLTAGDVFYKIKDVDEQGWCTGVKDGRTGLYPENYAEVC